LSADEQQMLEARRKNEEAQARYYTALTNKLDSPFSIWRSVAGNLPVIFLGGITVIASLLTLVVTNRTGLRFHYDSQFFEAIKLFGDKNQVVRSSGSWGPGQIANRHVPTMMDVNPISMISEPRSHILESLITNSSLVFRLNRQFTLYRLEAPFTKSLK